MLAHPGADFVKQAQNHTKLGEKFILIVIDILLKFEIKVLSETKLWHKNLINIIYKQQYLSTLKT